MEYYKLVDGQLILEQATQEELAVIDAFKRRYSITDAESNNADTEYARMVYGEGYHRTGVKNYTVILQDGVAVGVAYGDIHLYLDGERSYHRGTFDPTTGIGIAREIILVEDKI